MNNVNSQDQARAVAVDSRTAQSTETRRSPETAGLTRSDGAKAANSPASSGNALPAGQAAQTERRANAAAAQASRRDARMENAVAKLNDYVQSLQRDLRFSIDDASGRAVVSVIDRNSEEVIRQIPDETALRLARNLKALADVADVAEMSDVKLARSDSEAGTSLQSAGTSLGLINTRI